MSTPATRPGRIVVMGVAGCGKSTLGAMLARELGLAFTEGDDLHSPESRARMARGIPLHDEDRWPWLDRIGAVLARQEGIVACSALKRAYRDRIRDKAAFPVLFVHPVVPEPVIRTRLAERRDHYFPPSLAASQFAALEPLGADEPGFEIAADRPLPAAVEDILRRIASP